MRRDGQEGIIPWNLMANQKDGKHQGQITKHGPIMKMFGSSRELRGVIVG